ncbi:acyl-CoA synthetase, partial [Mesorhizobium amorphae CCNWGS0123]
KGVRNRMLADGLVPLMGIDNGLRAVANAVQFSELADTLARQTDQEIILPQCLSIASAGVALDEADAKAELRASGIAVPRGIVVTVERSDQLAEINFPVAVKALSAGLAHKSELGGVALNLETAEAAWQSVNAMAMKLRDRAPELCLRGFLVEEMVKDAVGELLVGIRRVDSLGLALTIGTGGTETELLRDTATVLLPASREAIADALRSLRLFPMLCSWRGRPKGDVEAAIDAIQKFAQFAIINEKRFIEAEINPLIVLLEGQGVVAVDAVMRLTQT